MTTDDQDGVTNPEQNREEKNRGAGVMSDGGRLVEVTDERALLAWDEYGRQTSGKS